MARHKGLLGIFGGGFAFFALAVAAANVSFRLLSPDLPPGQLFEERYVANEFGCRGGNQSPTLKWIVYDLPPTTTGLARRAGETGGAGLPPGAKQGLPDGDAPQPHYYGPCPDIGDPPHQYVITVYALNVAHLELPPAATAADVDYVISSKTLGKASITRPYQRSASSAK
jgi:hypothetical protein